MRKCFQTLKLGFQGWKLEFLYIETEVSNYGNAKKLMALYFLVSRNNFP